MGTSDLHWWQKAVFYQIYPRSFADGNGDGIGDLKGMISKIDYLQDLGIDAVWLSPHYPSPLWDCGYDVADYYGVAPEYGTPDDFKFFLDELHWRGMYLILDLVLNHTSDQHPWFIESRSSSNSPKRDWYVWRDGQDGAPPNNWNSTFGGPAWELDPRTGQYYYHLFFKQQPDLNWRNPAVKQAMFDVARHWLELGVDGFRLDAIGTLFEDERLTSHPVEVSLEELQRRSFQAGTPAEREEDAALMQAMFQYQVEQPETHALLKELRAVVDEFPERVLVGETDEISYYGDGTDELHMVFNFPLMNTERLTPAWVLANQRKRLAALPQRAWPCNTFCNHDAPRLYSRYGDGENDLDIARVALALVLTLRGTPFLYNGEEIGMSDLLLEDINQFRDMLGVWAYQVALGQAGLAPAQALLFAARTGRDKCRTPMQWSQEPQAGFCPAEATPWLPVNPDYRNGVNVAAESEDPHSLLNFYRHLLRVRKANPALVSGSYLPLNESAQETLTFLRSSPHGGQICLVAINLSPRDHLLKLEDAKRKARLIFSSYERYGETGQLSRLTLKPFEIFIAELL